MRIADCVAIAGVGNFPTPNRRAPRLRLLAQYHAVIVLAVTAKRDCKEGK
jgi:hypothetical protein